MHFSKIIILILFSLSFTQVRYSFELDGSFENNSSDGAFLVGYDKIFWKQKNVNSGIGFEYSLTESPDDMRFSSLYSIVNYNVEENWNMYSKIGFAICNDDANFLSDNIGFLLGFGINYNIMDNFHIEMGYHTSYIEGYEHSRLVYSVIKHFKFKDE